jgi:hypothetical protein
VICNWVTLSEHNNDYFILEKWDLTTAVWREIDRLSAVGERNSISEYQSIDQDLTLGTNYYRLRQVDLDGSVHTSEVESIFFNENQLISIFPNPSSGSIDVQLYNDGGYLEIYDLIGRSILTRKLSGTERIDLSNLVSGQYLVVFKDLNGSIIYNNRLILE